MQKNYYHVTIQSRLEGLIESPLELEESRTRLQGTLDGQHGQGMADILEFRVATEEEIKDIMGIAEEDDEEDDDDIPFEGSTKTVH